MNEELISKTREVHNHMLLIVRLIINIWEYFTQICMFYLFNS